MAYAAILGKSGVSGLYPTITISSIGATITSVTVTNSSGKQYTVTDDSPNWIVEVDDFDTYTVTGTYSGGTATQTVDVNVNQGYSVTLMAPSSILNDNSWEMISQISSQGIASSIWAVGDAKEITLNGTIGALTLNNYQPYVYILGFNHNANLEGNNLIHFGFGKTAQSSGIDVCLVDDLYSSAGSSIAFRMNTSATNAGGWKSSFMRNNICGTNLSGTSRTMSSILTSDLLAVIKSVTKYTNNTGQSTAQSAITTTTDYFFLLSEYEVFGSISIANQYEANYQQQYAYYSTSNSKIKYKHNNTGSTANWWLRSPNPGDSSYFVGVGTTGNNVLTVAHNSYGFAPAFCV